MATGVFQRRFGDIEDLVYSFWAMLLGPRAGAVSRWSLQERKRSLGAALSDTCWALSRVPSHRTGLLKKFSPSI